MVGGPGLALPGARRGVLLPFARRGGLTVAHRSTADRWLRIKAITADALERPESERPSFLDRACGGDETLLTEVASLLAADAGAGSFLEASGLADPDAARAIVRAAEEGIRPTVVGQRIGPYQVVAELGHGGMGVVYLAERDDAAFEKQVAIKVVRGGFAAESLMQRFQEERRILATLDHPNIARLLDAGTTADGLPYFVMEHVDGVPLTLYAARLPSLRDKLLLFHQVCVAVQYAHQHLVIHRDLKSGNILVTADGMPKLLDFGIAKLLEQGLEAEAQTRTVQRALTLEAASPEQVRSEPLTVTSDVYALGVLLFRLLTGQGPYGPSRRSDADLMLAICEEEPARPSAVAPIGERRALRGELDWITLQALRKEPHRRYPSVEQLADDIQHFLGGRPVAAAPDSWRYRTRKFASRHRTAVAAGVLLALSMAAGVTATLWQARRADQQRARAERRFADVRKLATSVMGELHDAIESVPGATAARALLLKRACEHLDALAVDAPDDPVLAEEVATAYYRLGELQGSGSRPSLADEPAALASHRKGLALRRALAARAPGDLEARSRLVDSLTSASRFEDQVGPSLALGQEAVAAAESLVNADPREMRFVRRLASAHYQVGSHHRAVGDNARALASFESAARLYQTAYDADPGNVETNRSIALCHKRLGALLVERKLPEALVHLRRAVELDEERLARTPDAPRERRDVSVSIIQLGNGLHHAGDPRAALAAYRRGLALREDLMRDDPGNGIAPRDVALALWWSGTAETALGEWEAAIASFRRAMTLLEAPRFRSDEMQALVAAGLAEAYEGAGRLEEALRLRKQVLDERRRQLAQTPGPRLLRHVVQDTANLGDMLARMGRWDEARAAYEAGSKLATGLQTAPVYPEDAARIDRLRKGLADVSARRIGTYGKGQR